MRVHKKWKQKLGGVPHGRNLRRYPYGQWK